ncbi:MAG: chemotaxis protein CheW [Phycisphaerales bacterium]|nr:chemotaxis protein CheW [Phycisphaerales bacterium]
MNAHSSQSKPTESQIQLVSFTVGEELFAVNILSVQEINRMISLTKVPQSPEGIEGVINLRGRIIPVLDLRLKFGLEASSLDDDSRIIVVELNGTTLGFIVDSVHEVLRINKSIIEPTPQMTTSVDASFVSGVAKLDDRLLILLNLDSLLSAESLNTISSMKKAAA